MVTWWYANSIRRQWQQAHGLVSACKEWFRTTLEVQQSQSSRKSSSLVATLERPTRKWGWNSRSVYSLLEHDSRIWVAECVNRFSSLQSHVQQECQWIGEHSWLFRERSRCMEVSVNAKTCNFDWPQSKSTLPSNEPRRRVNCYRCWWRNPTILESVPKIR